MMINRNNLWPRWLVSATTNESGENYISNNNLSSVIIVIFCVQRVCGCKFTAVLRNFRRPHKKFDICISTWNHTFQILYCPGN
jgi:hypothetical protein